MSATGSEVASKFPKWISDNKKDIIFSSPQKGQILYNWTISIVDLNVLQSNRDVQLNSGNFRSSLSLTNWHLKAKVNEQNLIISLMETDSSKHTFWGSDCSVSLPELIRPIKIAGDDQQLGRLKQLSILIPKQRLPTRGSFKVIFAVTITSNMCQHCSINMLDFCNQNPLQRMESILKNEIFWDSEINVGDKRFKVHKAILASVSEVFHKMFDCEMLEKTTGVVEISDIDSAVMSDFLMYIYTGTAPNLKQHAKELMIAADKYCVLNLTNVCTKYLLSTLSLKNAAEMLLLANTLPSAQFLKSKCLNYIKTYLSSISQTQSWQLLVESSSELAVECMQLCPVQSSSSAFRKTELNYIWIINEAKTLSQAQASIKGSKIESSIFPYPSYLNVDFTTKGIKVRLGCDGVTNIEEDLWAFDYSFSVLNRHSMQPRVNVKGTELPKPYHRYYSMHTVNCFTTTILDYDDDFDSYLYDGSLCIEVNVNIINTKTHVQSAENNDIPLTPISHLKLFENEWFSDVTIQVQDYQYKVHKVMLASASEVFQYQFENSKSNVLQVDDITPSVMSQMLTYIYTGNVPDIQTDTIQLLISADRYRIPSLVGKCVYEIQLKFTSSNVAEALSCANQLYYSDSIKTACIDFIKYNSVSVFKSSSWKSLVESSITLAFEVIQKTLSNKLKSSSQIIEVNNVSVFSLS